MPSVLAIDTSTNRGSIALLVDGELRCDEVFPAERSATSALFPLLEQVCPPGVRVDLIAVGLGPGSYAGVRIAIATAMGLGLARGAQVVGLPSVAALETSEPRYIAIGDARRETFYFTRVEGGVCLEGPLLLDEPSLLVRLDEFPDWPLLTSAAIPQVPKATIALPRASQLARLAAASRSIVATETLEPIYLREPHITVAKPKVGSVGGTAKGAKNAKAGRSE